MRRSRLGLALGVALLGIATVGVGTAWAPWDTLDAELGVNDQKTCRDGLQVQIADKFENADHHTEVWNLNVTLGAILDPPSPTLIQTDLAVPFHPFQIPTIPGPDGRRQNYGSFYI